MSSPPSAAPAPPPAFELNRSRAETDNTRDPVRWRPPDPTDLEVREAGALRHSLVQGRRSVLLYPTVTMPMETVCRSSALWEEFEYRGVVLQQIKVESLFLLNFHCRRVFEHHRRCYPRYPDEPASSRILETVLQLNHSKMYRCCTGVLGAEQTPRPLVSANAALELSITEYKAARSRCPTYSAPTLFQGGRCFKELANDMLKMTKQHIDSNFESSLILYVTTQLAYPRQAAKDMVKLLKSSQAPRTETDSQWLAWLEFSPTPANIAGHRTMFLSKLYDMLGALEPMVEQEEEVPKGCRLFTLVPQATSCIPSFYRVTTEVLYDVTKAIIATKGIDVFGLCKSVDASGRKVYATTAEFQTVRHRMWTSVFDIGGCVTHTVDARIGVPRRNFEFMISTNGYTAAVLTSIPTPVDRPSSTASKSDTLIGIDPGLRCMFTAYSRSLADVWSNAPDAPCPMPGRCSVCPGHIGGRRHGKKRPRRNRRRRHRSKRRTKARCDVEGYCAICVRHHPKHHPRKHGVRRAAHFLHDNSHVQQVSSREYRHLARIEHHAYWFNNLKLRYPRYAEYIAAMPSFKTASSTTLLARYDHVWTSINIMLEFCALKGFRKWRFTMSRFKRKAIAVLAKLVVYTVDPGVCVALGKWSSQSNLAGHMHVPLMRFAAELTRRATLIMVAEFRMSLLCSECFRPMAGMPFKIAGTTDINQSRNARRCVHEACQATCWERDVNAAKNIWQLGQLQVAGRRRTRQFVHGA